MSKYGRWMIVFGFGLMCLGAAFAAFNYKVLFKPFYDSSKYVTQEYYVEKYDIAKLVVDTSLDNIRIISTNSDEVKITYFENDEFYYEISQIDSVYTIKGVRNYKFSLFNFNTFDPRITIEIPEDLILDYNIITSNSPISLVGVNAGDIYFKTSNDDIEILNSNVTNNITLITSNDGITLKNMTANRISAKTSNGDIDVKNVEVNTIDLKTSNDEINLESVVARNKIVCKTSNGDIDFSELESPVIDLTTSNSSVKGTISALETEYAKDLKTSNGQIFIGKASYGKKLVDNENSNNKLLIKTSNANIKLNFR